MKNVTHKEVASRYVEKLGQDVCRRVYRLWPGDADEVAYRACVLAEEVGEVIRAITKRRHACDSPDGLCKGLTVDEWTDQLGLELGQAFAVLADIAFSNGIDLIEVGREAADALKAREVGV